MRLNKSCQVQNGTTTVRSWDDMNYDILLQIMGRVPWGPRFRLASRVSKTWLSAVLDSMSPPGVINLQLLDSPKLEYAKDRFCVFLKRRLNTMPPDSCIAFFQGLTYLKRHKYNYIGKRTPSMQKVIIPRAVGMSYAFIAPAMKYWKKLKIVQCPAKLILICRSSFTEVEDLQLFGAVDDAIATIIRDKCRQLKRLWLDYCALSVNALSTILDGHKKLELLDTRHSFRVADCKVFDCIWVTKPLEWNEEEIGRKAAGVKVHQKCARERCSECAVPVRNLYPDVKSGKLGKRLIYQLCL